jgi:hypothetical protein
MIEQLQDSPAGGKVFYDDVKDTCTVKYNSYTRVHFNRKENFKCFSKLPFAFLECEVIENKKEL